MTRSAVARIDAVRAIEDEIGVLVRRLKRAIAERAHAIHRDLQGASYLILGWLAENGPVRASAIVEVFGMDKGSLSRQLQHLEELGLVERTPDPADGRATLVSASAEAVRRLAEVDQERRVSLNDRLSDWSVDELEAFARQLGHYNRSLD
ncbi:MarR family transcriptional regulator [Nocardioides panacihumi]|uniref:MarR family transcriptional regulator n=1 Tax=Nocardioides panacihumi TaxID=400774 RepID=A0ABN2QS07_9ACTN